VSTNRKVTRCAESCVPDATSGASIASRLPERKRQTHFADKVYFANRLRSSSKSTNSYFGARKGTVKGFV